MYKGNSIVDYLKSVGKDSSKQARRQYAQEHGISGYDFSANKNIELLKKMQSGNNQKVNTQQNQPVIQNNQNLQVNNQPAQNKTNAGDFGVKNNQSKQENKYTPVQTYDEWIQRGKKPTELVDLVDKKYGVKSEYDPLTKKVKGYDANGNLSHEWSFDKGGFAVRKDIPVYTKEQFIGEFQSILNTGDRKAAGKFLLKHRNLYKQNKDVLTGMVKDFNKQDTINKKVSKLSSLDGRGLFDAYQKKEFAPGDDIFKNLSPEKQQEFELFRKRYVRLNAGDVDGKNRKEVVAKLDSDDAEEVYNKMALHNPFFERKYKSIILNNPERKKLQGDLTTKYGAIEKKRLELKRLKEKIKRQHPSASPSYINALLNRDSRVLLDDIEDLTTDYNISLSEYNMINQDLVGEYEAYKLDANIEYETYQKAIGISIDRLKTQKAFLNQKEILKIQYEQQNFSRKKNEEFRWKLEKFHQKNQEEKGFYQTNDKGELLYIVKGNAEKVLDSVGKVVATERYKNYQESLHKNDYGGYDIIRTYNDGSKPDISSYDMNGKLVGGMPSIVAEAINKIGNKPRQCGQAVNDYLQNLGLPRLMGNTYESKKEDINSKEPAIGGIAIWNPNRGQGKYKEYGHAGIITDINPDGTLEITDWNYNGDEKKLVHNVTREVIEYNGGYLIPKVEGKNINKTKNSKTIKSKNNTSYTKIPEKYDNLIQDAINGKSSEQSVAQAYLDMWNNGTMSIKDIYTKIGASKGGLVIKNELTKLISKQGGLKKFRKDDPAVQRIKDIEDRLNVVMKSNYLNDISGNVQTSFSNWATQGKTDVLADINYILEGKTLQQLIDAKQDGATFGALSNAELEMLRSSADVLTSGAIREKAGADGSKGKIIGFDMSEEKFKKELKRLYKVFKGKSFRMTGIHELNKKTSNLTF